MTRRMITFGIAAVVLVVVGGVGWWLLHREGRHLPGESPHANKSGGQEHAVPVKVIYPEQGGVERTVTRPGFINSFDHAQLFAQASGYLKTQPVDIGDVVKKDQVLAVIDDPERWDRVRQFEADLKKAQTQVQVQEAYLGGAKANLKQAHSKVEQARADLEKLAALVVLRKAQYRRIKSLYEKNAVEYELVDEKTEAQRAAESEERAGKQAVETAKSGVLVAEANVKQAQADLDNARSQVEVVQASLQRAKDLAEFTRIKAPFDGVITNRTFVPGAFIRDATQGGTQPLLEVARTDLMRVVVYVPDPDVPYAQKGQRATLVVSSLKSHPPLEGKVSRTALSEDYSTRTMRVEIDQPNPKSPAHPNGLLTNGMYGTVTIHLGKTEQGVTIPTAALFGDEKNGKRSVWVVENGKARRGQVQVGLDDGIRAEVLSGLKVSDMVVERHGPGLQDGVPVEIVQQLQSEEQSEQHHEKAD